MTAELEGSLSKIASLSKTLNEASDQISEQLAEIESALHTYALGVRAWVQEPLESEDFETEPDKDGKGVVLTAVERLGYGKHEGKWGFLVASGIDDFWPDNVEVRFLRDCPREIRLKAIERMPELLQELAQQLAKTTEEASKKAVQAKEIAAALRKKQR